MTVDEKVYALAEFWIADVAPHPEPGVTDSLHQPMVQNLAEHIQRCIEDWIETAKMPGGMLS